jgi:hypothetical protein
MPEAEEPPADRPAAVNVTQHLFPSRAAIGRLRDAAFNDS